MFVWTDLVACFLIYRHAFGVEAIVGLQILTIGVLALNALPGHYRRKRLLLSKPIEATPEELQAFADTRRKQFVAWLDVNRKRD